MAVIHSAKRWKPRQVKAQAKVFSKACQMDQVSLASVMMRLLCRGSWVCPHLASSDQETLLFNTVRLLSCYGVFRGNYWLLGSGSNRPSRTDLITTWIARGAPGAIKWSDRLLGHSDYFFKKTTSVSGHSSRVAHCGSLPQRSRLRHPQGRRSSFSGFRGAPNEAEEPNIRTEVPETPPPRCPHFTPNCSPSQVKAASKRSWLGVM